MKLETSDKWRLAKRELICFLPDSLDNDIGINYEDEDGVESPGKLTQYRMGVQPSMVTHWKTVSMARTMLSKLVIPWLGPSQFSRHTDSLALARRTVKQKI